ncbi:UNVERIFIED_CONTAM: hypothetical protein K2H54_001915 [Gekko kuhli]
MCAMYPSDGSSSSVLGTEVQDIDQLVDCLKMKVPVLTCTLQLRDEFEQEVKRTAGLSYVEDISWPGLGVVRYEGQNKDQQNEKEVEKITSAVLRKLNELESDLSFSLGPEFGGEKNCIYIGMVMEDLDVSELVETIAATGREIEENSRLLENMTEIVCKGIQEAQVQLQKANEERLLEEENPPGHHQSSVITSKWWLHQGEAPVVSHIRRPHSHSQHGLQAMSGFHLLSRHKGLLRQIPVVGSLLNWFSPFHASPKGRTFDLTAGSLESTEPTYVSKVQGTGVTPPPTPTSAQAKQRLPGQKLFKRSMKSSDGFSETSSVSHTDDLARGELQPGTSFAGQGNPELPERGVHLTEESAEDSTGEEMVQSLGNTGTKSKEQDSLR